MPDLGKYAVYVLAAYGVSLGLLAALILVSIGQARRTLQTLRAIEHRRTRLSERPGSHPAAPEQGQDAARG